MDDVKEADDKNLLNIQILPGSREVEHWHFFIIKLLNWCFVDFQYLIIIPCLQLL